jgi:protoporphyrinogen oxidase
MPEFDVIVIGAGPAGLTAAYELAKAGRRVCVLESDPVRVGGISRTVEHAGYKFDIGGHRFFSKSAEVNRLWQEILPGGMVERPRMSRIFYKGKFYAYPLDPLEALLNLGVGESVRCVLSFLLAKAKPHRSPRSFEDWVVNAFGRRLFEIFFKTYSEKVWGMPCSQISADWAAQRIKGLDLMGAILHAARSAFGLATRQSPKTLIGSFLYPPRGPGQMWTAAADRVRSGEGCAVLLGHSADKISCEDGAWAVTTRLADGSPGPAFAAPHLVSAHGLSDVAKALLAAGPTLDAARALRYRDYVLVALAFDVPAPFADNWLYVHDPAAVTGRIQNFGSWSPEMLPDPGASCLGFEYFCLEGDAVWSADDAGLVALAVSDLRRLGFDLPAPTTSAVVRQRRAYPVYDDGYKARVETVRFELERLFPTLHLAGRNGMHRYNNQDHAMMTGLVAARNILAGKRILDPWQVNDDAEYLEEGSVVDTFTPPVPVKAFGVVP